MDTDCHHGDGRKISIGNDKDTLLYLFIKTGGLYIQGQALYMNLEVRVPMAII